MLQDLMSLVWVVFTAGIFLVVEVVDQADQSPKVFIRREFASIRTHADLYAERMLAQTFGLSELS